MMTRKPEIYPRESHPISRQQIDEDALKILYRLSRSGFKAYVVGGGVRDLLLGKQPKDFDVATDASPDQIRRLFRNSRIIGRRFRLVHIYFRHNKNIEISTFRAARDAELPAETLADDNTFGTEESDAYRRDITINALFYDIATRAVIDYVGGMRDLMSGLVRVIGDPWERFREDPIRMVRAVRHAARASFELESSCLAAIQELHPLLQEVPPSRLYDELAKDLSSGALHELLPLLVRTGIARFLLPELVDDKDRLFGKDALFLKALQRLDSTAHSSPSVVQDALCIILLAVIEPSLDLNRLPELLPTEEAVHEHFRASFVHLPVPRRVREHVVHELWSLSKVVEFLQEGRPLSKRSYRVRLQQAHRLLEFVAYDSDLHREVKAALTALQNGHQERRISHDDRYCSDDRRSDNRLSDDRSEDDATAGAPRRRRRRRGRGRRQEVSQEVI